MPKQVHYTGPCPVEKALAVFGGKWKPAIIYFLARGTKRFNELRRLIPETTQKMLTQQLRDLERHGLIHRAHYAEIPPRVEYSLTDLGRTLGAVFQTIDDWQRTHLRAVEKARSRYDTPSQQKRVGLAER